MATEPSTGDLAINCELVTAILTRFIRAEIRRAGFQRAVMGISTARTPNCSTTAWLSLRVASLEVL